MMKLMPYTVNFNKFEKIFSDERKEKGMDRFQVLIRVFKIWIWSLCMYLPSIRWLLNGSIYLYREIQVTSENKKKLFWELNLLYEVYILA